MQIVPTTRHRLGALAAACLLSVALPAAPAWAQKSKTKGDPAPQATSAPLTDVAVDIPEIVAVDSNVDEAVLRDIFSGNLADNAEQLAGLTATSITIPAIVVEVTSTNDDTTTNATITLADVQLNDVADGVAQSITMASTTVESDDDGSAALGAFSASNFDIGGVLGIYGLVEASAETELKTIYTDFAFEGGTLTSPEVTCTIGEMIAAEFKARPLKYSFADMMALMEQIDEEAEEPPPELVGALLRMYADMFTAFQSSPVTFGGFTCDGVDDDNRPISISVASGEMGGMKPGFYPAISVDGMSVEVEGDGSVAIGNMTIKQMDLSGPIAAINAAPEAIDESWFEDNVRALIPAFEGFSFSDVAIDVPDPELEGSRIKASVGGFDLTLLDYLNGIPTNVATTGTNILVDLPADSSDEQIQQLLALGITSIDAGFGLAAQWNEADDTIAVTDLSVTGADLATVKLIGTITNATEALFGLDENEALVAAMAVAISNLKLDVTDEGLSDIILKVAAAEQGQDPAAMRPVFAGLAEGTIVGMLAGAAEAQKVGSAINAFVSGKAKHLTIDMTAKEAPGLGMADFIAAEQDPTVLIGKVTIEATAK